MPRSVQGYPNKAKHFFKDGFKSELSLFDFHLHTTWTDGSASVKAMHQAAIDRGLKHVLFSEHGRKTSGDWFSKFVSEVRALPETPCKAWVGLETKVDDFDGSIDSTTEILNQTDLVMASVHRFPGEQGIVKGVNPYGKDKALELELKLALAVLDNPHVDILGHPFGMATRRFGITPTDEHYCKVIQKAAQTGVAIEINSHYHPDPWKLITWCLEFDALISLGSNAHRPEEVGAIQRLLKK